MANENLSLSSAKAARACALFVALLLCASGARAQDLAATPTPSQTIAPRPTSSPTPSPSPTPSATPTPDNRLKSPMILSRLIADAYAPGASETVGPRSYPRGLNPLTGLPYPSDEASQRRNLIVKISNWPPKVRPQKALNQADLVYEFESEGGVTRFAAIFRSQAPERVGSVRSARLVDMELLTMYAGLLAYSGTSGPIRELYKENINRYLLLSPSLGDNCESAGFCRDEAFSDRGYEHTLFGDARLMWQAASRRNVNFGYRALGFAFGLQPSRAGETARDIYINWYNRTDTRWQYDEDSGRFLRYSDGAPHIDAADGEQLWADNLIMLQAAHNRRPDLFEAGALNESYEVALWGQGRALVLRDGEAHSGHWRRQSRNRGEALSLIYAENAPILLKPGRTWVTVLRNLENAVLSDELVDMNALASETAAG